jgi:hypothetical protein
MFLDKRDILGYRIIQEKIKQRHLTLEVSFAEKLRMKLDGWTSPPWRKVRPWPLAESSRQSRRGG